MSSYQTLLSNCENSDAFIKVTEPADLLCFTNSITDNALTIQPHNYQSNWHQDAFFTSLEILCAYLHPDLLLVNFEAIECTPIGYGAKLLVITKFDEEAFFTTAVSQTTQDAGVELDEDTKYHIIYEH